MRASLSRLNGRSVQSSAALALNDRAAAYGDGLFETMRVHAGRIPLLPYHLARMKLGLERLHFNDVAALMVRCEAEITEVLSELARSSCANGIFKLTVSRGVAGRGYAPPLEASANLISQFFEPASRPSSMSLKVATAQYRLGLNSALAGIKHLNRLDQVLAAHELQTMNTAKALDDRLDDLLLFSVDGKLIESTKSNVLVFTQSQVLTPRIDSSGVAGTLRAALLAEQAGHGITIVESELSVADLASAQGLALCNSVFGLQAVTELDGRALFADPRCDQLASYLMQRYGYAR